MIRLLALVAMLAAGGEALAGDTSLVLSGLSYHFDRTKKYNEQNFGLGLEHRLSEDFRLSMGWYRNSLYRTSRYAGLTYAPLELGPARIGVSLGAVTGYYRDPDRVLALVLPTLMIDGAVGINIGIVPPSKMTGGGGMAMQLKWRLP